MPLLLKVNNQRDIQPPSSSDIYPLQFLASWQRGLQRINFTLVHSIQSDNKTPLLQHSANMLFCGWDVISCSLVDYANRGDIAFSASCKGAHPLHLELDVPVQNILGTHVKDVAFPNHAGRKWGSPTGIVLDKSALTHHIFNGIDRYFCKIDGNKGFNQLMHFQDFILQGFGSSAMGYNEILVIGRPGVNYYGGQPCTGKVSVKGISYVPVHLTSCSSMAIVTEQIENDIQSLLLLTKLNNLKYFTNRLYNSKGGRFALLNERLFQYFGPSQRGVYKI